MPKLINKSPKYRLHRSSGQAVVTLSGIDNYLGPHGTKVSRQEYDRVVAEWLARGRVNPKNGLDTPISVVELLAAYIKWAKGYYAGDSREVDQTIFSVRPLKKLYGRILASEFGPLALKAVRHQMIADDVCRTEINIRA